MKYTVVLTSIDKRTFEVDAHDAQQAHRMAVDISATLPTVYNKRGEEVATEIRVYPSTDSVLK